MWINFNWPVEVLLLNYFVQVALGVSDLAVLNCILFGLHGSGSCGVLWFGLL